MKEVLLCLLFVALTQVSGQNGDNDVICSKKHFIQTYIDKGEIMEEKIINNITKQCKSTSPTCRGVDTFNLLYAESVTNDFMFIIQINGLLSNKSKDCWGSILEITNNRNKSSIFINFNEYKKKDNFEFYEKVVAGNTYTFTLTSLPSGTKENISMKAPDKCGNEVQKFIYDKQQQENWFGQCPIPDIKDKLRVAEEACNRSLPIAQIKASIKFNKNTCQFEVSSQGNGTTNAPCSKENFIYKYVKTERYLEPSIVKNITTTCQKSNQQCTGTNNLEVIYAESTSAQKYYFVVESKNLLNDKAKACWGFALEIYNNKKQVTKYFNFEDDKKKNSFVHTQEVVVGHTYIFTLISLPSGMQEIITLKAPGKCGNRLLEYLYKKEQNGNWTKGCKSPDLREKLYFVDTFCKRINDNIESYNKYKDKVYQDGSTCQLVLPKELKSMTISRSSSGMPIAASPSKFTTKDFIIVTMLYIYVNYMLFVN